MLEKESVEGESPQNTKLSLSITYKSLKHRQVYVFENLVVRW